MESWMYMVFGVGVTLLTIGSGIAGLFFSMDLVKIIIKLCRGKTLFFDTTLFLYCLVFVLMFLSLICGGIVFTIILFQKGLQ